MPSKSFGIQQRGGGYYYRKRVPNMLRPFLGKTEIVVSLRTRNETTARRNAEDLRHSIKQVFGDLMANVETVTHSQAKKISEDWKRRTLNEDFEERIRGLKKKSSRNYMPMINRRTWELNQSEYSGCKSWASEIMTQAGQNLDPASPDWMRMTHYLLRAEIKRLEELQKRDSCDTPYEMEYLENESKSISPALSQKSDSEKISKMYESWYEEEPRNPRTVANWNLAVKRFIEFKGDLPVSKISAKDIRDFKREYAKMPKHLKSVDRDLTMPQLLEKYENTDVDRLKFKTVNNALAGIRVALEWCVENDIINANPAKGIKQKNPNAGLRTRIPFSHDDLKVIFEKSPVFEKGKRYTRGGIEACFWIPVLALYTGARLEEIGCLYPKDVVTENGIPCIDIYADEKKRVKNLSSNRKVPIHQDLIAMGLLEYAARMQQQKQQWLFPHLKSHNGRRTHYFSRWFGDYLRKQCDISDKRKTFHSLRHTFKDAGREAGLETELNNALTGHKDKSVSGGYGDGYSLKQLHEGINKIRFDLEIRK